MGVGKKEKRDNRKELNVTEHLCSVADAFKVHGTDPTKGLTSTQVTEQRAKYGSNCLTPPVHKSMLRLYIDQYLNFFSILLMAGGVLCFIAYGIDQSDPSNLYLGIVLEVVVIASSTFGFMQEAKSNAIMNGFKSMIPKKCKVMRDGAANVLDASELVPGDLVEFQEGDQVPADIRVVHAYNLKVDNSALTGESEACERFADLQRDEHAAHNGNDVEGAPAKRACAAIEATNLIFYSTIVAGGHGKGLVIGTGDNTQMGQIAGLAGEAPADAKTPIQHEVDKFIFIISAIAIVLGAAFLGVGIGLGVQTPVQSLVYCISVIVATVPEGLLVTLTVALALTAKRMHSKNVLVKNLNAVETLGCTQVIASDKTGTLTQNRMTVQHAWYDGQLNDIPAPRNFPQLKEMLSEENMAKMGPHGWKKYDAASPTFQMLQRIATLCNNSDLVVSTLDSDTLLDLNKECERADFDLLSLPCTGDASESGLVKFVQLLRDAKEYRKAFPKLFEIKFNSTNKWQLSIHDRTIGDNMPDVPPLLLLKGAPERVIARCSRIMINGKEEAFTPEWQAKFQEAYDSLGSLGERVLGFAYRSLDGLTNDYAFKEENNGATTNFPTEQLTFAGLLSLMDPPRDGVPEAVTKCNRASVKVFMVTGDHPITAKAIAKQVGIVSQESLDDGSAAVVTGDDLRDIMEIEDEMEREEAWNKVLAHEQIVFARVTPAHKLLIVENNQRLGRIVAVTGDGVNDAPALKKADIGVSMGIAGKDVSKEAADMILMDDNFASIVNGVEEGRLIFDNLKKSICYTLTSKPPELLPFLLWVAGKFPLAISTILILAVDLGTDMIPAISLAYETREADIMARKPRNSKSDHLVDFNLLWFTYLHFGVLEALAGFYAFILTLNDYGYAPNVLLGRGLGWEKKPLICQIKDGRTQDCGYGCGIPDPANTAALQTALTTAYPNNADLAASFANGFCPDGCAIPPAGGAWDPFVEFTPTGGFRGFAAGAEAVCTRSCAWYASIVASGVRQTYLDAYAKGQSFDNVLGNILTPEDDAAFVKMCAPTVAGSQFFGFPGRKGADEGWNAPVGAVYWWAGQTQTIGNTRYGKNVLQNGQSSYFFAVVLCKAVCALVSKTRRLSIFSQGLLNNKFLMYAILFEICLAVCIVYVPFLNVVFNTQPIFGCHLLLGIPWAVLMFVYDESRKWTLRKWPGGFTDRAAFY